MRRLLGEIGPLLAGFQIAVSIVGFFGIGAVAKWILINWFPFTRWIWTEFFSFLKLPEITAEEKDALTTFSFFAPMAISSFISWWRRDTDTVPQSASEIDTAKEIRLRIYATLIGAGFMVVVGGSVIQDAVALFTTEAPKVNGNTAKTESLLNIESFARFGVFSAAILTLIIVSGIIYIGAKRINGLSQLLELVFLTLTKRTKSIKFDVAGNAMRFAMPMMSMIVNLLSFGSMFGGIIFAAGELGPIRTAAPLLVLISLFATIYLDPARLLKTGGVVIALVTASVGWDFARWVVKAVENAPID